MRSFLALCLLFFNAACSTSQSSRSNYLVASPPQMSTCDIVFVANGAGDSRSLTKNLSQAVAETNAPLQVETFAWSVGYKRSVADQTDRENHAAQGCRLAAQINAYLQANPGRRVYLVAHSAGCAVVLIAAAQLPPESIERIVLLSPSVCACYDLRPALRATRAGIDNFYSYKDRWVLGLGMRMVGTTEEGCRIAAGRVGFTPISQCPDDAALSCKLRQHPWNPDERNYGHNGGHFGNQEPAFLKAYVVPLLVGN